MLLSFPIGLYLLNNYNYEDILDTSIKSIEYIIKIPYFNTFITINFFSSFILFWSLSLIIFIIGSVMSFKKNTLVINRNNNSSHVNMILLTIQWFTIIVFLSMLISFLQSKIGINVYPPIFDTMINFFHITKAPIIEELGFRSLLIGLPIFLINSKPDLIYLFKILYCPYKHIQNNKKYYYIILVSGFIFGLSHVLFADSWNMGKIPQATLSGIILGWIYFRYGLILSILVHWSINYFIFSYMFFISYITNTPLDHILSNQSIIVLEIILIITGIISLLLILLKEYIKKKPVYK